VRAWSEAPGFCAEPEARSQVRWAREGWVRSHPSAYGSPLLTLPRLVRPRACDVSAGLPVARRVRGETDEGRDCRADPFDRFIGQRHPHVSVSRLSPDVIPTPHLGSGLGSCPNSADSANVLLGMENHPAADSTYGCWEGCRLGIPVFQGAYGTKVAVAETAVDGKRRA